MSEPPNLSFSALAALEAAPPLAPVQDIVDTRPSYPQISAKVGGSPVHESEPEDLGNEVRE